MLVIISSMDIAVGDLEADQIGSDETQDCEREIDERGNILAPELRVHATRMTENKPKTECARGEEQGQ